jgi:aminoglycoside phosphotransferase (APT) family kinase protein
MGTPRAEIDVDADTVRRLLSAQFPPLADLPIVPAGSGWDNVMFRLGTDLAVRLPRRRAAVGLIENEQRWLPKLAARLPLAVPAPVHAGKPQDDYPWPWSITPWIAGEAADLCPPRPEQGAALGRFLAALHAPAPPEAPRNPFRGVPLVDREPKFRHSAAKLAGRTLLLRSRHFELWDAAIAEAPDMAATWIHGDLHPRNVLVMNGAFSGVVDWGDIAQGDRACDLAAIWMILPDHRSREQAMAACAPVTARTWRRARGWAVLYSAMLLHAGLADDERMAVIAECTLQRLLDGP